MPHKPPKARALMSVGEAPLPQTPLRIGSILLEQTQIARHRGLYQIAVDLPSNQRLTGSGKSQQEAFIDFCTQVSSLLFPDASARPPRVGDTDDLEVLQAEVARRDEGTRAAIRTKAKQKTVGVTCKVSLIDRIGVDQETENFARTARDLFERGLDVLENRLEDESSRAVFDEFQSVYGLLPDSETKQWMLRLERRTYERALVLANEYDRSLSNLAAICITNALKS